MSDKVSIVDPASKSKANQKKINNRRSKIVEVTQHYEANRGGAQADEDHLRLFLNTVYGKVDFNELAPELCTIVPKRGPAPNRVKSLEELDLQILAAPVNKYVGPGLYNVNLPYSGSGRPTETDVVASVGVVMDLDYGEGHSDKSNPKTAQEAFMLLNKVAMAGNTGTGYGADPSLVVWTGGGYHAWWLLDEPGDTAEASELWCKGAKGLAQSTGLNVDNVSNLNHLMRPAGACRDKSHDKNVDAATAKNTIYVVYNSGARYTLKELEAHGERMVETYPVEDKATYSATSTEFGWRKTRLEDDVTTNKFFKRFLAKAIAGEARHTCGLDLACQLRDNYDQSIPEIAEKSTEMLHAFLLEMGALPGSRDIVSEGNSFESWQKVLGEEPKRQPAGGMFPKKNYLNDESLAKLVLPDMLDWKYVRGEGWTAYDGRCWGAPIRNEKELPGALVASTSRVCNEILHELDQCQDELQDRDPKEVKGLLSYYDKVQTWANRGLNDTQRKRIVNTVRAVAPDVMESKPEDFDTDRLLLNCANGMLDLATMELRPHRREHLVTRVIDVDYNPEADCPLYKKVLNQQMDPETVEWFQMLMGYCLTGLRGDRVILVMYGIQFSGKSTITNTPLKLLGAYGGEGKRDTFLEPKFQKSGSDHSTDLAALTSARMVLTSELNEKGVFNTALCKNYASPDGIQARDLGEKQKQGGTNPEGKLIFTCNHLPSVNGNDAAFFTRLKVIKLLKTLDAVEFKDLVARLDTVEEREGLLAWMVEGWKKYQAYQKAGVTNPLEDRCSQHIIDNTLSYKRDNNWVENIFDEFFEVTGDEEDKLGSIQAFDKYREYCAMTGDKELSKNVFSKNLRKFLEYTYADQVDYVEKLKQPAALVVFRGEGSLRLADVTPRTTVSSGWRGVRLRSEAVSPALKEPVYTEFMLNPDYPDDDVSWDDFSPEERKLLFAS